MLILLESKRGNPHIPFATKCLLVIILIFSQFAFFPFFSRSAKNTSKFSVTYDFLEIGKINPQREKSVFHDRKRKFLENTMKIQITGFSSSAILAELLRAKRASGAPWVRK